MAHHSVRKISGDPKIASFSPEPALDVCDLCGLTLRYGTHTSVFSGKTFKFCCRGCNQVFTMLYETSASSDPASFKESGLFRTCQEMGIIPASESDLKERTQLSPSHQFVSAAPADLNLSAFGTQLEKENLLSFSLKISSMWCPACAWLIQETLNKSPGVVNASCTFSTDWLRCDYNPVATSPAQIIGTIHRLGYAASTPDEKTRSKERKAEFVRIAVSAFLTINIMMLSFALYSGFFRELPQDAIYKLSWPSGIMASIVLFYGGLRIYQKAWKGFTSAIYSMETLIAIGSFSAYLYSTVNLFAGSIHLYYDTASMLVTLVLLGKFLEGTAKGKVQEDLDSFFSLRPSKVRICSEHYPEGRYVAAEQLQRDDFFRVEESEIVPADGIVLEGKGIVDESSLTGEAQPIKKNPGDQMKSGSRILRGALKVKAEGVGKDSILGQMLHIMEKALDHKTPREGNTDRILQWFVPMILILALLTGVACFFLGLSLEESIIRAITVTVISCPCALGIAIPLARVAGISGAGRKGILVRDFSAFEQSETVSAFVFDKTGTITEGLWKLLNIIPFKGFSKKQILALATSLENDSDHYIAREIKRQAAEDYIRPAQVEKIVIHENGISGHIGNSEVRIGSRHFLQQEIKTSRFTSVTSYSSFDPVTSTVYMGYGGKLCALFVFGDKIKEGSTSTVERLRAQRYTVSLVSGDGDKTTKSLGRKLDIEKAFGGMLPNDKAAFIEMLQKKGQRVAMVGDGINDAPALVQSDLAIAIYSGSNLGTEAADISLMRGEPEQIFSFLELTKQVNSKVKQNFFASFGYNIIAIPIAMTGLLTPLVAVCAMLMSSLSVIGNTLLLTRKTRKPHNRSIANSLDNKIDPHQDHKD